MILTTASLGLRKINDWTTFCYQFIEPEGAAEDIFCATQGAPKVIIGRNHEGTSISWAGAFYAAPPRTAADYWRYSPGYVLRQQRRTSCA